MPKVKEKSLKSFKADGTGVLVCSPYFKDKKQNTKLSLELPYGEKTIANMLSVDYQWKSNRKSAKFFDQECLHLAKSLLGQLIVHKVNGTRLSGFVVETECYLGKDDTASHSFNGKRTPRNEPMFMKAGTSYVYSIYGMYHCYNISSKEDGSCVLIRALEPYENLDKMEIHRQERIKNNSKQLKHKELCNGPSKLCQALNITKESCNKVDMTNSDVFWVEDGIDIEEKNIITSNRIGISSAGEEWANKPFRFYVLDNTCVSVRDRKAEDLKKEE